MTTHRDTVTALDAAPRSLRAAERPAAATTTRRSVWLGFVVVIAASVMDVLDSTIAQTAAPAIRADLASSFTSLEWISAAYTLAMSIGLLVGGRLGDVWGRRQVLLGGMGGFAAASVLCALAPSAGALIVCRALQGTIGAIMIPQGFGLIRELFGDGGQQKAFAVFALARVSVRASRSARPAGRRSSTRRSCTVAHT